MPENPKIALLVMGMQEGFKTFALKLVPEINDTIRKCRTKRIPIIFTQHGHRYPKTDGGGLAEKWGIEDFIIYGSDRWQFIRGLDVSSSDIQIVEKRRYDAFYGTILDNILKELKVDTIVIAGVMSNLCCESTARSAFDKDYKVIFLRDGTNTRTHEMQAATLLNIEFGIGQVLTCAEFRKFMDK